MTSTRVDVILEKEDIMCQKKGTKIIRGSVKPRSCLIKYITSSRHDIKEGKCLASNQIIMTLTNVLADLSKYSGY